MADEFYRTCGKAFRIRHIAKSLEDANEFCTKNPDVGVIDNEDMHNIIVAELKESKAGQLSQERMHAADSLVRLVVRTGEGDLDSGGEFTDIVTRVNRVPRQHAGWQSVAYRNERYRLGGGIRTGFFICINNPVKKPSLGDQ